MCASNIDSSFTSYRRLQKRICHADAIILVCIFNLYYGSVLGLITPEVFKEEYSKKWRQERDEAITSSTVCGSGIEEIISCTERFEVESFRKIESTYRPRSADKEIIDDLNSIHGNRYIDEIERNIVMKDNFENIVTTPEIAEDDINGDSIDCTVNQNSVVEVAAHEYKGDENIETETICVEGMMNVGEANVVESCLRNADKIVKPFNIMNSKLQDYRTKPFIGSMNMLTDEPLLHIPCKYSNCFSKYFAVEKSVSIDDLKNTVIDAMPDECLILTFSTTINKCDFMNRLMGECITSTTNVPTLVFEQVFTNNVIYIKYIINTSCREGNWVVLSIDNTEGDIFDLISDSMKHLEHHKNFRLFLVGTSEIRTKLRTKFDTNKITRHQFHYSEPTILGECLEYYFTLLGDKVLNKYHSTASKWLLLRLSLLHICLRVRQSILGLCSTSELVYESYWIKSASNLCSQIENCNEIKTGNVQNIYNPCFTKSDTSPVLEVAIQYFLSQSTIDSEGFKGGTRGALIMPRDAVSRTANAERNGGYKWVKNDSA